MPATTLVFLPPYRDFDPPVLPDTPEWQTVPAIYFTDLIPRGTNVFVLTNGTITEEQPPLWEDVRKVYWGGHIEPVTAAEAAALSAVSAEYASLIFTVNVDGSTPLPDPSGGSGGSGGGTSTGNYGDGNYGDGNYGG